MIQSPLTGARCHLADERFTIYSTAHRRFADRPRGGAECVQSWHQLTVVRRFAAIAVYRMVHALEEHYFANHMTSVISGLRVSATVLKSTHRCLFVN
jgi:hypothetical protein